MAHNQRLVHQTVTVPAFLIVSRFGQGNGFFHKTSEGIRLRKGLTIKLIYPLRRTIGRDDDNALMLVTGLSHSWSQIEQGRTTGDTDDNRFFQRLRHTQRIKTCTTLIRHRIARDVRTLVQIVYDR